MALPLNAVLTDPDETGEHDIEISHSDHFLLVRASCLELDLADPEEQAQR
jgi:hypothetical protein